MNARRRSRSGRSVPLSELKAHLSDYLSQVAGGQRFLLTERGQPVGILEPVRPAECLPEIVDALARTGLVRRPRFELPDTFFKSLVKWTSGGHL